MSQFVEPKSAADPIPAGQVIVKSDDPRIPEWLIQLKIQVLKVIGDGSYSVVYKVRMGRGSIRAAKLIQLQKQTENYKTKFMPRELDILKRVKHENIIETKQIIVNKTLNSILILMKFASGGTLYGLLKRLGFISEAKTKALYIGMVKGLEFMHSVQTCHRDLKTENILIDGNGIPKLTDFSFSIMLDDNKYMSETHCGTHEYLAPEVLSPNSYKPKPADVWSMGILLFEMLNGDLPFKKGSNEVQDMQNRKYAHRGDISLTQACRDLVYVMLDPNPKTRITMPGVAIHAWLQEVTQQWQLKWDGPKPPTQK